MNVSTLYLVDYRPASMEMNSFPQLCNLVNAIIDCRPASIEMNSFPQLCNLVNAIIDFSLFTTILNYKNLTHGKKFFIYNKNSP